MPPSGILALPQPRSEVALSMQDTPHVDVVVSFDVEDQVRIAAHGSAAQPGKVQFVRVAGGPDARVSTEADEGSLQGIDECARGLLGALRDVVRDGLVDVTCREGARDDGLAAHRRAEVRGRTRARSVSK